MTEEDKELIIQLHTIEKMNTVQIAEKVGYCQSYIERTLKKSDAFIKTIGTAQHGLSLEQENDIIKKYIETTETTLSLGEKFGVSDRTIALILKKKDIPLNKKKYLKCKKLDFFNKIDNEMKAYFLGWMISDGNICKPASRNTSVMQICLDAKDKQILYKFAEELGIEQGPKLCKRKDGREEIRLVWHGEEMVEALALYGVVPRKTRITFLPIVPDEFMPHLIRGIFDGDGTATKGHFTFTGNKECLEGIRVQLKKQGVKAPMTISFGTTFLMSAANKHDRILLYNYLYGNSTFCLERKRQKILSQISPPLS